MIKYILYKIFNNFLLRISSKKFAPMLRSIGEVHSNSQNFFFDLSDGTTHLGDRLFFLPLILRMIKNGYSISLSECDLFTKGLIADICGYKLLHTEKPQPSDIIVYPKPSYLNFKNKYPNGLLVDFTDDSGDLRISEQLVRSFEQGFGFSLDSNFVFSAVRHIDPAEGLAGDSKYYLFSNYINSGRFRKYFVEEDKLLQKCIQLKRQGYKIVHVGSKQDLDCDAQSYDFVDVDLRGKATIHELIRLVDAELVVGAVTYDNFLMHLVGMYGKTAYVLFRGRFTRKNREHHMLHVNNTFFDQKDKLIYL